MLEVKNEEGVSFSLNTVIRLKYWLAGDTYAFK